MLSPKRVKWRKQHVGRIIGKARSGNRLHFGTFGLQAVEPGRLSSRQIEAARVAMTRSVKRGGNIWVRVFPDRPITKKAAETRMGSGKGNVEEWAAFIKPDRIIFEMEGITKAEAFEALRLAGHKLPIKCKIIDKEIEKQLLAAREAARKAAKVAKQSEVKRG